MKGSEKTGRLPTTRWTLILTAAGNDTEAARAAIGEIYLLYFYPVYEFARRQGLDHDGASDLVQNLFTDLIRRDGFRRIDRSIGRFRNYLLAAARHRLVRERKGTRRYESLGSDLSSALGRAERRFRRESRDGDPEHAFIVSWARELVRIALGRVREHFLRLGALRRFGLLLPFAFDEGRPYEELARELGKGKSATKTEIWRFRKRVLEALREAVRDVTSEEEADDELRFLMDALRR